MLVAGKQDQVVPGMQTVAVPVLGDVEDPFGTDDHDAGIDTAALVYKIPRSEYLPARLKHKGHPVGADKVPHLSPS
jgi:hypothetical protein